MVLFCDTVKEFHCGSAFSDVPHPQQLVLERQLTNSVLISWRPPHGLDPSSIQAYHVYLNGVLKATLKGSERTKALLEDVDASQVNKQFGCVTLL